MIILLSVHPQYIKDANGENDYAVITSKEFEYILDRLKDSKDAFVCEGAEDGGTGERISFANYLKQRKDKSAAGK